MELHGRIKKNVKIQLLNDKDYWSKKLENLEYGFWQRTKIL